MDAPLWLLLGWGGMGAIDFVYNHIYRYRLHAYASSFREHGVHTLLVLVLIVTVVMLVFVEMGPLVFAVFPGVQVCTVIFTLWDVSIEPASRKPLGGLPPHEKLVHTIAFLLHGAFVWAEIANADQLVHGAGLHFPRFCFLMP